MQLQNDGQNGTDEEARLLYEATYTNGRKYWKIITFPNINEMYTFVAECRQIKQEMDDIHFGLENQQMNVIDQAPFQTWLQHCNIFIQNWGTSKIPEDIRLAIQDVQQNLNLPVTDFGDDTGAIAYHVLINQLNYLSINHQHQQRSHNP